jgi:Holliday junction resolvase-like predicted endonuclease
METLMLNNYYDSLETVSADQVNLRDSLVAKNYPMIIAIFNRLISNIAYKNKQLLKDADPGAKESFYRANVISFLHGANFFTKGEVQSKLGSADIVAEFNKRILVIEVKYVDVKLGNGESGKPSASKTESRCREKLREAVQQLYNKNYAGSFANPMTLAIVLDESYKGGCISHAAYGNVAYRIHGDPETHTPIGDICEKDNAWSVAWRDNA